MRGAKGQLRRPVLGKTGHPPGFGVSRDARIGARDADRGQKGGKWAFLGRFVSLDGFPDGFVSKRQGGKTKNARQGIETCELLFDLLLFHTVEKQRMPVRALKPHGHLVRPAVRHLWKNKECPSGH